MLKVSSSCLGFKTGVRDFRREAGAWNMVVGFTLNVQLGGVDGSQLEIEVKE